jgi:hypothetical protein
VAVALGACGQSTPDLGGADASPGRDAGRDLGADMCPVRRSGDGLCLPDPPPRDDRDRDGHTRDVDCDDLQGSTFPGAPEFI